MIIPGPVYTVFVIAFAAFTAVFALWELARRRSR